MDPIPGFKFDLAYGLEKQFGITLVDRQYNSAYAEQQQREDSFTNWPGQQSVKEMSSAGFYFLGHLDRVKCHICSVVLGEWKQTDEPWFEHAKHSRYCSFVLLHKGLDFVEAIDGPKPDYIAEDYIDGTEDDWETVGMGEKEEEKLCVICMDEPIQMLATPCGHFSYCGQCITKLKKCGICRSRITGYIRAFTV